MTRTLENEGVEKFIVSWNELLDTRPRRTGGGSMSFRISVSGARRRRGRGATVPALVTRPRRQRHHRSGPAPLGPGGRSRGRRSASAGPRPSQSPGRSSTRSWRSATSSRPTASRHIVLGGMGGSSLAPEVITRTHGVGLTVLDSTDPGQVLAALGDRLEASALVISSKSGSTVETDSQRARLRAGVPRRRHRPAEAHHHRDRPGSPLDKSARAAGYRVFNADPTSAAATRR